tara:strand:- start:306 stop:599 length:294 start_codon:yes stop_codon:yes gene_type:complete
MKTFKDFLEDIIEFTVVKREKKTSAEKMKQKKDYKKNKVKKAAYGKKYRAKASTKMLAKKSERMAKKGQTATGRAISVAGGSGAAQRQKEKKTELAK